MNLSPRIYAAARRQKLTLEALRVRCGLPNGTFYNLVAGKPPRVLRTFEKLKAGGVRIPRNLIDAP